MILSAQTPARQFAASQTGKKILAVRENWLTEEQNARLIVIAVPQVGVYLYITPKMTSFPAGA
jgi:hypothetical protein